MAGQAGITHLQVGEDFKNAVPDQHAAICAQACMGEYRREHRQGPWFGTGSAHVQHRTSTDSDHFSIPIRGPDVVHDVDVRLSDEHRLAQTLDDGEVVAVGHENGGVVHGITHGLLDRLGNEVQARIARRITPSAPLPDRRSH
jgi:hypothetical protein